MLIAFNLVFATVDPPVGRLSLYNWLLPGRLRFPFERAPLVVDDLDALFAAHVVSTPVSAAAQYRVFLLGDSQTWGPWLSTPETLGQLLNGRRLAACGRSVKFYNLAAPFPSLLKDFFILQQSLRYRPNLIVWFTTPNSFIPDAKSLSPIMGNPGALLDVLKKYSLERYNALVGPRPTIYDRSILSLRSRLRLLALLQIQALHDAAVGVDTRHFTYPPAEPLNVSSSSDLDWQGFEPPNLDPARLFFDVFRAAHKILGPTPMLVVDEPMYVPPGGTSSARYNLIYPRWAFDAFRERLPAAAAKQGWSYLDLFDVVPANGFRDNSFHLTADGEVRLAEALAPQILTMLCPASVGQP